MAQKTKRPPVPAKSRKPKKRGPQSAQQTIPYKEMLKDGICKVWEGYYTKTLSYEDINYAVASSDDQSTIFDGYCGFLNYFDSALPFQLSFINHRSRPENRYSVNISPQDDDFNSIRREFTAMLENQIAKSNNGIVRSKYITFGISADGIGTARPRLERIEADIVGNFKKLGVQSSTLSGRERLEVLHSQLHPGGREPFRFSWDMIPKTGMGTKDFIAPTSFDFRQSRTFRVGTTWGAALYMQIKEKYSITYLCKLMSVNRSGYYKWKNRKGKKNQYQIDRDLLTQLIIEIHEKHKSFGYHRIASFIKSHTDWIVSDNLVHKCCKFSNIKSKAKHYKKVNKGKENTIFTNIVAGDWNVGKPLELVASDMTRIRQNNILYEWTYILDTYNNEIISHHLSTREGDRTPYYQCLEDLKEKVKEQIEPVILHTDQGSVYSSRAFKEAHKDYNIIRSMSRVGTPTDNPIIESINGWIKAEIRCDYTKADKINFPEFLDKYVQYFNNERPAYALGYLSPVQYRTEQGFP